ncbi:MAG: glycerol kinase GlpK [Candidatus Melainabacteria bacterium]|nr:glycerol kinase GlpK [Candidatus Melainabacteria bacterium]MBI3307749.1 glycerol kinase GlpK [Candidatus Melainabacteria bacterium]
MNYILSIDQGTTSSRTILIDAGGKPVGKAQKEFNQYFPKPSWVEHNPEEIWKSQLETISKVLSDTKISPKDISAVGITNQRETVVAFDSKTGKPIYNAIVWQCRRTVNKCEELKLKYKSIIKEKTGLEIDAYFSGPKMEWIIENVKEAKELIKEKRLRFGTIDSWLIWNLTGKKEFYTDPSNASRTMLYNIKENKYDDKLMSLFQIEEWMLPKVLKSNGEFGYTDPDLFGTSIPIRAVLGDQQAALFGNACFNTGDVKVTYGTGGFLLINIGDKFKLVDNLITTIAWSIDNSPTYAIEGSTFISGAIIQWLRDGLGIIKDASETESLAISLDSNEGVYLVPALSGLGAPYWDGNARGIIIGLTRGTTKAHIVRAALESMAYQIADLVVPVKELLTKESFIKADGGATKNNFLLQFQADLLNMNIVRSSQAEATAIGVGYLTGLSTGIWKSKEDIQKLWKTNELFLPRKNRLEEYKKWKEAVKRSFRWN